MFRYWASKIFWCYTNPIFMISGQICLSWCVAILYGPFFALLFEEKRSPIFCDLQLPCVRAGSNFCHLMGYEDEWNAFFYMHGSCFWVYNGTHLYFWHATIMKIHRHFFRMAMIYMAVFVNKTCIFLFSA